MVIKKRCGTSAALFSALEHFPESMQQDGDLLTGAKGFVLHGTIREPAEYLAFLGPLAGVKTAVGRSGLGSF